MSPLRQPRLLRVAMEIWNAMDPELQTLRAAVQRNCHISDARHAGEDTLCVYLLKMREYFRWEQGHSFRATLSKTSVAGWLTEREQLWEQLEDAPFEPVPVNGQRYDPFDTAAINAAVIPLGLVYSGGIGRRAKPHFFLADLERRERYNGFTVLISAHEYARDLSAPPAMSLQDTIFVRRESLRRLIWEKVEEWRWSRRDNPMGRAIAYYDFDRDPDGALEAMTGNEVETLILHEAGEVMAGRELGGDWEALLATLPRSRAEIGARAVRDLFADCLSTLPTLLKVLDPASLHFYVANLTGMRKELFPRLIDAYHQWIENGDLDPLNTAIHAGASHWRSVATQMREHYRQDPDTCAAAIESLILASRL